MPKKAQIPQETFHNTPSSFSYIVEMDLPLGPMLFPVYFGVDL